LEGEWTEKSEFVNRWEKKVAPPKKLIRVAPGGGSRKKVVGTGEFLTRGHLRKGKNTSEGKRFILEIRLGLRTQNSRRGSGRGLCPQGNDFHRVLKRDYGGPRRSRDPGVKNKGPGHYGPPPTTNHGKQIPSFVKLSFVGK